jgi:protein SCO1
VNSTHAKKAIYLIAILISLGLGITLSVYKFSPPAELAAAQLLPTPAALPNTVLENHRGEVVTQAIFQGQWSLVFFGFTSCPDVCPLELQKMGKLLRLAGNKNAMQVVFVSVDPERDSAEKMADYVTFFHENMMGVRGKNTNVAQLAQFFGASYDRSVILDDKVLSVPAGIDMPSNAGDTYQVNHSTRFFIVNPKGELMGSFAPPHEVDRILSDMKTLMN